MTSDLDFQDTRVPSFIPFDADLTPTTKKLKKRKRKTQAESKPVTKKSRKRLPKNGTLDAFITTDINPLKTQKENHIWVGAIVEEEFGAFGVYFGENDERNFSNTFKIEDELHNLDYGHVLGTLNAINSLKLNIESIVVNATCRDLPQAITNPNKKYHYKHLADKIRDAIKNSKHEIHVRHISARSNAEEHKLAIELASDALKKHHETLNKSIAMERTVMEDVVMDDIIAEDTVVEDTVVEDTVVEDVVVEDAIVEDAIVEDAIVEDAIVEDAIVEDTIVEDAIKLDSVIVIKEHTVVVTTEIDKEVRASINEDKLTEKDNTIEVEEITNEKTITEKTTIEETDNEETITEEIVIEEITNVKTITEETLTDDQSNSNDMVLQEEKEVEQNKCVKEAQETQVDDLNVREIEPVSNSSKESIVTTTVIETTTVDEEKEAETKEASSWASVFGIRNLLDVLYSPFKTRKS